MAFCSVQGGEKEMSLLATAGKQQTWELCDGRPVNAGRRTALLPWSWNCCLCHPLCKQVHIPKIFDVIFDNVQSLSKPQISARKNKQR